MLRNLILIAIFTVFTVFSWIGFTIYHNSITTTVDPSIQSKLEPITPHFDREVFNMLENRSSVEANLTERVSVRISSNSTPQNTPTPVASATPTLRLTATPTSTASAQNQ